MADETKKIDDGGSAFPQTDQSAAVNPEGMSLRDWFAGQYIVGLAARPDRDEWSEEQDASRAYVMADAMLSARSRGGRGTK